MLLGKNTRIQRYSTLWFSSVIRLCTWERSTGRTSILVLREAGWFQFRADSGKPLDSSSDEITDEQLFQMLRVDASGF